MTAISIALTLVLGTAMVLSGREPGSFSPCDINQDGSTNVADVQTIINQALGRAQANNDLNVDGIVNVVDVQIVINAALGLGCAAGPAVTISDFNPKSGSIGTLVTITGSNFGSSSQASMPNLNGGSIALPLQSLSATSISVLIPSGAVTGPITVSISGSSATTASPFSVTASNTFSLTASPAAATLIQGQSIAYMVQLSSANGFNQLAQLSVTGQPSGITASFKPSSITAGQTSVLTLTAPANQPVTTANISISASATVAGIPQTQSALASLAVVAPTTSLIGRTVVSDPLETPLAGVTITTLGLDGNSNTTGCTGHSTVTDSAGNFLLTNLPQACTGPQLIEFDGTTATTPAGKYAGVNLVFTLVQGQVTPSPVLVHLPRIDNVETFMVQQNAAANQSYNFTTIPGLSVTVYPGTTFTMADGTKPNPFPLAAVQVPVDRLPDLKPNVPTMIRVFIVAFQPANTVASQPVAVSFPNVSNTPPGTDMTLMTLDPTHGQMVPYGTGAVSANGMQVVPDPDPMHPGHLYGLVHFDWHGQMPPPPSAINPSSGFCKLTILSTICAVYNWLAAGEPVDLTSGLQVVQNTDISIAGARGSISVQRVYRTLSTADGPFGLGTQMQYAWLLDTGSPSSAELINLISPDGNRFPFSRQPDATLRNLTLPWLQGAVMTTNGANTTLRNADGTVFAFQAFAGVSYLGKITDRNGNTTTLTVAPLNATTLRITKITDPVGRSISLAYDSKAHLTSASDLIGRAVTYTYNSSGTLATVTDPLGGVTKFQYDSQNRVISETDPRGALSFQNTYDSNGRVSQQAQADGGVIKFSYALANSLVSTSPVIATTVTDAIGNPTTYRFNMSGFLTDVTDALGQTKSITRDPGNNSALQVTGPAQCAACGTPGSGPMQYSYDGQGNLLTAADALGNTVSMTYNPTFSKIASFTDALGHTTAFAYDSAGNLLSVKDANGNSTVFTYDSTGLPLTATDPLGNLTTISYDPYGNPATVTDAMGNVTTTVFDAVSRPVSSTDPLGRRSARTYDSLDRILSTTDGRGNTTTFSYDAVGNLIKAADPQNNARSFAYDAMGRVSARTSPLGESETFQYDLNGNIVQYTDRRGQISSFQYDALSRLTTESYQDGATVFRMYDPYSRLSFTNDSVDGVFTVAYDAAGRVISQNEPTGSVQYTRDAVGHVVSRQVAGQPAATYSYDPLGNMLSASTAGASVSFTYGANGLPNTIARNNGVVSTYTHDPLGHVLSIVHANTGVALNTQTYSYDESGKRVGADNDLGQPFVTQGAAGSANQDNELLASGPWTYTYDANGNRIGATSASGTVTYQWDSRNRLKAVTSTTGATASFRYDSGRRVLGIDRSSASSTTNQSMVLDNTGKIASLTGASGAPQSVLTSPSDDSAMAVIDLSGDFSNIMWALPDADGSPVAVADPTGTVEAQTSYDPFGQATGSLPSWPTGFMGFLPAGPGDDSAGTASILVDQNSGSPYDPQAGSFVTEPSFGYFGDPYSIQGNSPTSQMQKARLTRGGVILQALEGSLDLIGGASALALSAPEDAVPPVTALGVLQGLFGLGLVRKGVREIAATLQCQQAQPDVTDNVVALASGWKSLGTNALEVAKGLFDQVSIRNVIPALKTLSAAAGLESLYASSKAQ